MKHVTLCLKRNRGNEIKWNGKAKIRIAVSMAVGKACRAMKKNYGDCHIKSEGTEMTDIVEVKGWPRRKWGDSACRFAYSFSLPKKSGKGVWTLKIKWRVNRRSEIFAHGINLRTGLRWGWLMSEVGLKFSLNRTLRTKKPIKDEKGERRYKA